MGIDLGARDADGRARRAAAQSRCAETAGPASADGGSKAAPELDRLRRRTLQRGVNRPLLALTTAILVPFFRVFLRLRGVGETDLPRTGPLLLASNHRSFLDPFVIGALVRRPIYYVAKRELFARRWQAWLLGGLGAFPIDRGAADTDAMATAKAILQRGECVVIFPEGTRVRPGPLGTPRRGVGRLALETGAPVVPVAVLGTEEVRAGWRLRPRRVRICFGAQLRFSSRGHAEPSQAAGATARIWSCIVSQWESLGGEAGRSGEASGAEPAPAGAEPVAVDPACVGADPVGADPVGADPVGADPVGADPVGGHPEPAIAALADRLTREGRQTVPIPLAREESLAAPRSPYTLQ